MDTSFRFISPNFECNNIHDSFFPFSRFEDEWNLYEILKTILLTFTLLPIRMISHFIATICCYIICLILMKTTSNDSKITSPLPLWKIYLFQSLKYFALFNSWIFGIYNINYKYLTYKEMKDKYGYKNEEILENQNCCIIVSNHLSFTDIPALFYLFGASFVAKGGVASTPFFGIIARCIHTLFVEQGKSLSGELKERINLLNQHKCNNGNKCILCIFPNLVIFPEGTTTNGRSLIAFRSGIFYASKSYPIRPIAIYSNNKYIDFNYSAINPIKLIFRLLTQFRNDLNIIIGAPYIPNKEEINNPLLYTKNINILISKMLDNVPIYLLNKKHKFSCYFKYINSNNINKQQQIKIIKNTAKDISNRDNSLKYYQSTISINNS